MTTKEQDDADDAVIKRAMDLLGEHFDSVQVFVTRYMPAEVDGTRNLNIGVGNWFTRYGQVREWLVRCDARTTKHIIDEDKDQ